MSIRTFQNYSQPADGAPTASGPNSTIRFTLPPKTRIDLTTLQIYLKVKVAANTLNLRLRSGLASLVKTISFKINGVEIERYDNKNYPRLVASLIDTLANYGAQEGQDSGEISDYGRNLALTTTAQWVRLPLFPFGIIRKRLKLNFERAGMGESVVIEIQLNDNTDALYHATNTDEYSVTDTRIEYIIPSKTDPNLMNANGLNIVTQRFHLKRIANSASISENFGLSAKYCQKVGISTEFFVDDIDNAAIDTSDISNLTSTTLNIDSSVYPSRPLGTVKGLVDYLAVSRQAWNSGKSNQIIDIGPSMADFIGSTEGYVWVDIKSFKSSANSTMSKRYPKIGTPINNADYINCQASAATASTYFLIMVLHLQLTKISREGQVTITNFF